MPYPVCDRAGVIATTMVIAVVDRPSGHAAARRAPFQTGVLATLGLSLILQNAVILTFGGGYKILLRRLASSRIESSAFSLAQQRIVIVVGHDCGLRRRSSGWFDVQPHGQVPCARCRRTPSAARSMASTCEQVVLRTFVLGAGLAALSGVLTAPINVSVYGGMGESITLKTFAGHRHGRHGQRARHAYSRRWILGIAESLVAELCRPAVSATPSDSSTLMLMLMLRPHGLFCAQGRF